MKKLILISFIVAFISCSDEKKQNEKIIKDLNLVYKELYQGPIILINLKDFGLHSVLQTGQDS